MIKLFRKHWLVTIREIGSDDVVQKKETFIVRDRNAWLAYDAIKVYLKKKRSETSNKWDLVSMTRV